MAINMSLTKTNQSKPKFSVALQSDAYKNLINNTLRDPVRANKFVASISSAVATNPALQECEAGTILSAALLGESLNLSPSTQLGQFYLVPFKDNKNNRTVAQFQLGYKGYIQLAIRSGYYKKLNVIAIKEGELISYNPLTEELTVNLIEDDEIRENTPTIGYYAMFEYSNGFTKTLYWSKKKMLTHADKYSQAFSLNATAGKNAKMSYADFEAGKVPENEMWKYSSFWYKDFDGMAYKTMLRQLISKWGIMSVEMQDAFDKDMSSINTDGKVDYVDNQPDVVQPQELSNNESVAVEEPVQETAPQIDDNQEIEKFEGDL